MKSIFVIALLSSIEYESKCGTSFYEVLKIFRHRCDLIETIRKRMIVAVLVTLVALAWCLYCDARTECHTTQSWGDCHVSWQPCPSRCLSCRTNGHASSNRDARSNTICKSCALQVLQVLPVSASPPWSQASRRQHARLTVDASTVVSEAFTG